MRSAEIISTDDKFIIKVLEDDRLVEAIEVDEFDVTGLGVDGRPVTWQAVRKA